LKNAESKEKDSQLRIL